MYSMYWFIRAPCTDPYFLRKKNTCPPESVTCVVVPSKNIGPCGSAWCWSMIYQPPGPPGTCEFVLYFGVKEPSKRRPKLTPIKTGGPIWVPGTYTGVIIWHQPKQCTIKGKSLKFTIDLNCFIHRKWVISWSLLYACGFTKIQPSGTTLFNKNVVLLRLTKTNISCLFNFSEIRSLW